MRFTDEDIKLIEKFIDIKDRGYYCDGGQLTQVYNRVLEKNVASTSCGACLRQRINELQVALQQFKKSIDVANTTQDATHPEVNSEASEEVSEDKVDNSKEEDKKPLRNASSLHSNSLGVSKKENKKVVDGNQHRPKEVKK